MPSIQGQVLGSVGEEGNSKPVDPLQSRAKDTEDIIIADSLAPGKQTAPEIDTDSPSTSRPHKNAKHSTEHFDLSTPVGSDADQIKRAPKNAHFGEQHESVNGLLALILLVLGVLSCIGFPFLPVVWFQLRPVT